MNDVFYHTQEKWSKKLTKPIICKHSNAWLGKGYYFWKDEFHAVKWGLNSKKSKGSYEIYKATVISEDILDTVFNKDHYEFWVGQIEKIANKYIKKENKKPELKYINNFLLESGILDDLDGILFQDISKNEEDYLMKGLQYKKRIQLVAFKLNIIHNFELYFEGDC